MNSIIRFLKNWSLPVSIVSGMILYFAARAIPFLAVHRQFVLDAVSVVQPTLIFFMLFITFCKVEIKDLRPRTWHTHLLIVQVVTFALLSLVLIVWPHLAWRVVVESAMLCLICPTATAGAVVTTKLGGDAAGLTSYTILINMAVALVVPALIPLVAPHPDFNFATSFFLIMGKVFPMLICPLFAAIIVRHFWPTLLRAITTQKDLAFYIWCFTLPLAIAVATRSIVHSDIPFIYIVGIAIVTLASCIFQFAYGRHIGRRFGYPIAAGQSLGQKNTVFAIWMGYTFLTPVSAVAGGFYSIWHNVFNSWQLYQHRRK